jgi:hypothetical protein
MRAIARREDRRRMTYFVALRFIARDDGCGRRTDRMLESGSGRHARRGIKPGHTGAVAFSRRGDPATGEFGDAKLIEKFGEAPEDLSML